MRNPSLTVIMRELTRRPWYRLAALVRTQRGWN